jgi:restriction system protein
MTKRREGQGPQFTRFMGPLVQVIKELGGAAAPAEVREKLLADLGISEQELAIPNQNGQSRIVNQVYWAKFYLAKAGLIETSPQGLWTLTARS